MFALAVDTRLTRQNGWLRISHLSLLEPHPAFINCTNLETMLLHSMKWCTTACHFTWSLTTSCWSLTPTRSLQIMPIHCSWVPPDLFFPCGLHYSWLCNSQTIQPANVIIADVIVKKITHNLVWTTNWLKLSFIEAIIISPKLSSENILM